MHTSPVWGTFSHEADIPYLCPACDMRLETHTLDEVALVHGSSGAREGEGLLSAEPPGTAGDRRPAATPGQAAG